MRETPAEKSSYDNLRQLSLAQLKEIRKEAAKRKNRSRLPPLVRQARSNVVPLSYAQERLWVLDQLGLLGSAYNTPMPLRLEGALNEAALERSFAELLRRHESLRTRFAATGAGPVQIIAAVVPFTLDIKDLSDLEPQERARQVERLSCEDAQRPFDLTQGPLLRACLLKLSQREHILLLTLHHIVSDGWSLGVLKRELSALYGAFAQELPSPLAELPIQYADYAIWQREWLRDEILQSQLQYWRERIAEAPPQLQLPTDHPRPTVATFNGALQTFELPLTLRDALGELARGEGATLFMVILAAFQLLLSRYCGVTDVVVGSGIAGRTHANTESLIGFFVNMLALRTDLSGNPTFRELLRRVKEVTLGAYSHQDLPFEKLVQELRPERSLTRQPLFQVALAYQNYPEETLQLAGLTWTPITLEQAAAPFDLTLHVFETREGLRGELEYMTDLFDRSTIERMAEHLACLLKGIASDPDSSIQRVNLLAERERELVLNRFNDTTVVCGEVRLIHQQFEDQAARTPHAEAVAYEEQLLTYAQLNSRANQLARHLRERGAGPGQLVALFFERGLEMVVAVLATLKSGAAYVPLDPAYPAERLVHILAETTPCVLVTQRALSEKLPASAAVRIETDTDSTQIAAQPAGNLGVDLLGLAPEHLAYVIYTSGSTGKPKGVMVSHRNLIGSNFARHHFYGAPGRFLLLSPLGFDSSVAGIFATLTSGGTLLVASQEALWDPAQLLLTMRNQRATRLLCVPALYQKLLSLVGAELGDSSLSEVIVAGEACPPSLVEESRQRAPAIRLFNEYGPTEATVWASVFDCLQPIVTASVPIGRPIANTQIYLLDEERQLIPIGVVGEIYIGGVGVACGYLHRPDHTVERFVPDPFSPAPGARLYRTGDLARWRADGTIEYVGRNDHQVKLRGFRIELGEIEAQLLRHPQVKQAVVVAREDDSGEKRLVAYVVANPAGLKNLQGNEDAAACASDPGGHDLQPQLIPRLHQYLKEKLPAFMVPSAYAILDALPLTFNGKINRGALPEPERGGIPGRVYEAPRGEVEEQLATIWQELLRLERVGRNDNFFELGGHSLLLVQMKERLRRVGWSCDVRAAFESVTLAAFATTLVAETSAALEIPPNLIPPGCEAIIPQMLTLVELEPEHIDRMVCSVPGGAGNIQDIYPLTALQEGMLFHHLLSEHSADAYIRTMLLSLSSRERLDEFIHALQQVIDRHDILRTAVLWKELPQPVQVVNRKVKLPVDTLVLRKEADAVGQLTQIMRGGLQRLDLTQAPLMRLQLAADPHGDRWYALLRTHHLVCDNEAADILLSEVCAFLEGRAQSLPEPGAYRSQVAQALAQVEARDPDAFFRGKLADVEEPTAPFGVFDVHGDASEVTTVEEALAPALATNVRLQARRLGVSAATLFHAVWALVVGHTAGKDDVVYGTVLLGRLQGSAGAQRILGMFINTLPLRLRLAELTAHDLVNQTRRELLELLSYEQASLSKAQRCSGMTGSAPLFTALLNYRHAAAQAEAKFGDAAGIELLGSHGGTNYPLVLSVVDQAEGFVLQMETDRRIDPHRMIGYVLTAMRSLVTALESAPQTPALALPVLPESERQQVTGAFSGSPVGDSNELIHQLFERQVERTPEAVAVVYEGQSLTYAALNQRANQLAGFFRGRGVGPDRLVGVCLERSLEMVVGVLGILKAGGAYVPLDPAYPRERLAYLLNDAAPELVLIQERLRDRLPEVCARAICIDADWNLIAPSGALNGDPAALGLESCHLAYVIYTSGSTGEPKGVMIEHRHVANLARGLKTVYGRSRPCERVALNASLNFDASVQQLVQLLAGHTLFLVPQEARRNASLMVDFIRNNRIEGIDCTPSQLKTWVSSGLLDTMRHRPRTVLVGGEPIDPQLWRDLSQCSDTDFINVYGPTECTVDATLTHLTSDSLGPHIGRPMQNRCVYILDCRRQPVGIGVTGEIYIGGAGVGRGYLRRPELTLERFLPDPFSATPQSRMYRTGDLGCWRPDGTIAYRGRNDTQVKIRGFRIELGEIEAQLRQHPQVKESAVLAREDEPGEKRLVAYVVARESSSADLNAASLRAHLQPILPDYMLPSAFVVLGSLPLTVNGKLDRRALPAPQRSAYGVREYEAPQGEIEEILAGIWQGLLQVERVSRHDHFFALGGHSLLIVQMLERLRRVGLSTEVGRVFDHPTLADLACHLSQGALQEYRVPPNLILPDCEAITAQMLPLVELQTAHIERIVRAVPGGVSNIQDIYPLAPLQEGILFHHLLDQDSDTYARTMLLSLVSRERLAQLIEALQLLIDRHDILRTAVLWEQLPQPLQVVYRRATLPVTELVLEAERDPLEQLKERMKPGRLPRLDLRQAPLLRLQISPDSCGHEWYVLLQTHHLVCDNESVEILFSEVVDYLRHGVTALPEPVAYRDHVAQALAYARTHDAESFFRGKLGDIEEPTAPFGLLDVHGDGSQIETAHEPLELTLSRRVRAQARRLGVSAATLFHAAWGLVVARTSGRDDVVYGTVLLGRLQGRAGAQRILGMFINTLPLRLPLRKVTAKGLVEQTQRELVELLNHEQSSLALAQRCSGVVGSKPLFSALLNYRHSTSSPEAEWSGQVGITSLASSGETNYPLTVSVDDLGEGFAVTAQTDRRIDPQRMVQYVCTAVQSLVEALETAPRTPALALSILPQSERHQVLELFNATEVAYPTDKLIHELFEEQVQRTPDAVAVICEGRSLTYTELNARANQLARYLRARQVGPDQLVGLCVERSLEMVVGLLGVLKAGGAYVPLDPSYPAERLRYMLADACPGVLLTQQHLTQRLPQTNAAIVAMDGQWAAIAAYAADNLDAGVLGLSPDHLAYVIYTSGSTGQPKGVMIAHRQVINLLKSLEHVFRPSAGHSRIALNASLNFDASVQQWVQLLSGCALVVLTQESRLDAEQMLRLIDEYQIDGIDCTPSQLRVWISSGLLERAGHRLQTVLVGGEAIDPELWSRLANCSHISFYNVYGPTECTVDSTLASLHGDLSEPHIGRPMHNRRIYILDLRGEPVPIGVSGEIYIGGAGVARGYLNQPELTAERFLKDPFSRDPQARMYKTGDLGRWRAQGILEYCGRNDHQVKLRGYRIELGEIESQLARHEAVSEAVVMVRQDSPGEPRLVAYVVPPRTSTGESTLGVESLRMHLQAVLPEYMVPSVFVLLESLPLTPNGKLDRRALPAPGLEAYTSRQYEAPVGEIEAALARIWGELLRVERIGRQDNFFELGGHSLQAMKLIARSADQFEIKLSIQAVFRNPTLERMAQVVGTLRGNRENLAVPVQEEFEEGVL